MGVFNFPEFLFKSEKILPTVYEDSLSYYEVLGKAIKLLNNMSAGMNSLANALVSPYDSTTSYTTGMYCWNNSALYKCINANYGSWNLSDWEEVVFVDSIAEDFSSFVNLINETYESFTEEITTNESFFIAIMKSAIGGIAQYYNSDTIYEEGAYCIFVPENVNEYDSTHIYQIGDYCIHNKTLYECNQEDTTGEFNPVYWYLAGTMYQATENTTGTFDPTKWRRCLIVNDLFEFVSALWNDFFAEYELNLGLTETIGSSNAEAITQKSITEYFNNSPTNLLNLAISEVHTGYYSVGGSIVSAWNYLHTFIPCSGGDKFFTNITISNLTVTFFDSEKNYVGYTTYATNRTIEVPTTGNIAYMSIPLLFGRMATYVVATQKISDKYVRGASCGVTGFSESSFYRKVKVSSTNAENTTITCTPYKNCAVIKTKETSTNHKWIVVKTNITHAIVEGLTQSILLLAYSDRYSYGYVFGSGSIIRVSNDNTTGDYTTISSEYANPFTKVRMGERFSIRYGNTITIQSLDENEKIEIPIYKYISDGYKLCYGYIWRSIGGILGREYEQYINCISVINEPIVLNHNQWEGKKWYAYGTSITNINSEGKYPFYLRNFSGMELTNKGISGGGIGDLGGYSHGQVYSAICNTTDGKLEADLITLETGANDATIGVPLGTIYDTGTETLAGCLNDCLRYLQANTNAQICVFYSPSTTTRPNATNQYFEWAEMVRKICFINGIHYLDSACNLGYGKITSDTGNLYVVDNIHQTYLGGYIYAQNIWSQLKQVPTFKTSLV